VRLSAIGDVVRTLPAINAWHRQSPETRFTWLVEPAAASVLQGHPAIDKVLIFERGAYLRVAESGFQWLFPPRCYPL